MDLQTLKWKYHYFQCLIPIKIGFTRMTLNRWRHKCYIIIWWRHHDVLRAIARKQFLLCFFFPIFPILLFLISKWWSINCSLNQGSKNPWKSFVDFCFCWSIFKLACWFFIFVDFSTNFNKSTNSTKINQQINICWKSTNFNKSTKIENVDQQKSEFVENFESPKNLYEVLTAFADIFMSSIKNLLTFVEFCRNLSIFIDFCRFFLKFLRNYLNFNKCWFVEFVDRFQNQYFFVDLDFNKSTNQYFNIDFSTSTNQHFNIFQQINIDFGALDRTTWLVRKICMRRRPNDRLLDSTMSGKFVRSLIEL